MSDPIVFTNKQQQAFDLFKAKKSLFITGPAGCGKSFIIKQIQQHCQKNNINVGVTAMTGAAAALIGGQTLHRWAGIGLGKHDSKAISKNIMTKNFPAGKRWRNCQVLIIDEVSMMSADLFNKLNTIAQTVRRNRFFFGAIQMIFCGDFAQLEPIKAEKFCFESTVWQENLSENTIYFNKIIRQNDSKFQKLLCEIRLGQVTAETQRLLRSKLIKSDQLNAATVEFDGIDETVKPTILYPHRQDVHEINTQELDKLISSGAKSKKYIASDCAVDKHSKNASQLTKSNKNLVNSICNAPSELTLYIGELVMLIKNIDFEEGLVNGTRGVVTKLETYPTVVFDNGVEMLVERVDFELDGGAKTFIKRSQIPLALSWALTIHKCQGATLSNVVTDLSRVFCAAQSYVTLSRVKSLEGLHLLGINFKAIKCNPRVKKYYQSLIAKSPEPPYGPLSSPRSPLLNRLKANMEIKKK